MDHAEPLEDKKDAPSAAVRLIGSLHRGALQEIKVDRLINAKTSSDRQSISISANNQVGRCVPSRNKQSKGQQGLSSSMRDLHYRVEVPMVRSEPRHNRKRSTSGDFRPKHLLFEDDTEENFQSEAFGLRRRTNFHCNRTTQRPTDLESKRPAYHPRNLIGHRPLPSPANSIGRNRPRSRWVIPVDSSFKVIWDIMTVILSLASSHALHVSIRERKFGMDPFMVFSNVWFMLDILLNFCTERRTPNGEILWDYRSICARYLTSWFAVDLLALVPWEALYVKPIIDVQNKRGLLQKYFFRSRAVVRVTRHLRGKHVRWFGTLARRTKQHGVGASRLLRLIIKYIPKYFMFFKNMKGGVVVRVLRQFQWFRRFYNNILNADGGKHDASTGSLTKEDLDGEDDLSSKQSIHEKSNQFPRRVFFEYEKWELMEENQDDEDDGVPL